jgi:hypothetical protein
MAKRDVLHELEEYLWPTIQKLAVGKILRTSRSDRQEGNNYKIWNLSTIGGAGSQTTRG